MGNVTPIDHLQRAKRWLETAIVHLEAQKEEDAVACIQYAIEDETRVIKEIRKT